MNNDDLLGLSEKEITIKNFPVIQNNQEFTITNSISKRNENPKVSYAEEDLEYYNNYNESLIGLDRNIKTEKGKTTVPHANSRYEHPKKNKHALLTIIGGIIMSVATIIDFVMSFIISTSGKGMSSLEISLLIAGGVIPISILIILWMSSC